MSYTIVQYNSTKYNTQIKFPNNQFVIGKTSGNIVYSKAAQIVAGSAFRTQIKSGGSQYVLLGSARNTIVSGGRQIIPNVNYNAVVGGKKAAEQLVIGGTTYSDTIKKNGSQIIAIGNSDSTVVSSGGVQIIKKGTQKQYYTELKQAITRLGGSFNFNGSNKATLHLSLNGIKYKLWYYYRYYTLNCSINLNAQCSYKSKSSFSLTGKFSITLSYRGRSITANGSMKLNNRSYSIRASYQGNTILNESGSFSGASVTGISAVANSTTVLAGGKQIISAGKSFDTDNRGKQIIVNRGISYSTINRKKGQISISNGGVAKHSILFGKQIVQSKGTAQKTHVSSGGVEVVKRGGVASQSIVSSGGRQVVSNGGKSIEVVIKNGGVVSSLDGATIKNLTVSSGGQAKLISGNILGTTTIASGGRLDILGKNIKINKISAKSGSIISFKLSSSTPKAQNNFSLHKSRTYNGTYMVTVAKTQSIGSYKLSTNVQLTNKTDFSIFMGSKLQGAFSLADNYLDSNGRRYSIIQKNNNVYINLKTKYGAAVFASEKNETLSGTTDSDIFYTGRNSCTVQGSNGRDVVVYDTRWGNDLIKGTHGTITLLFTNVKQKNIVSSLRGSTMTITKKNDSSQKITVENWNEKTHNIVFSSGMSAFKEYVNTAEPSSDLKTAMRKEVWKNTGLSAS
ncbi:MAG: hypothetical protein IJT59_07650 [Desulfovibrionaceae bacterium]|nr:hypothetical protein [Desulfovibrionaceae bacterium]